MINPRTHPPTLIWSVNSVDWPGMIDCGWSRGRGEVYLGDLDFISSGETKCSRPQIGFEEP